MYFRVITLENTHLNYIILPASFPLSPSNTLINIRVVNNFPSVATILLCFVFRCPLFWESFCFVYPFFSCRIFEKFISLYFICRFLLHGPDKETEREKKLVLIYISTSYRSSESSIRFVREKEFSGKDFTSILQATEAFAK